MPWRGSVGGGVAPVSLRRSRCPRAQDHNKLISPDEFGHLLYAIFGYTYKKPRKDAASVSLTKLLNALYAKWKQVRRVSV